MRLSAKLVTCLFAAPLAFGVMGCGKIAEKIQEKVVEKAVEKSIEAKSGGQVQVDLEGKKLSAVSKSGKQVTAIGESATLPADFPKQVPLYPGAALNVSHADNSGAPKYALMYTAGDSPDKVTAFYKDELKSFKLEQETNMGSGRNLLFTDKAQAKLRVQLIIGKGEGDNGSTVMLNVETLR